MNRKELIKKYINFFKEKKHKEIPNSSLIPQNDPTTLFISAGMQPLVPFLLGQKHPLGKRLVNVQKCIRTGDIEEVGDTYHHTFFEMLGNWSLGDYWKEETIKWSFEFLTQVLNIPMEKLAITCFKGDSDAPKDEESAKIWTSLGIPKKRIAFLGKDENWWGPAGKTGPCGPDTEMFYWNSLENSETPPEKFNPNDKKWIEIWNDVLMQYVKDEKGNYNEAKQKNIDTGMGVERTVAALNNIEDDYLTDSFKPLIEKIENFSGKKYNSDEKTTRAMRIISDHIKASVFIIADGIQPGNTEQGYVLRRLIRRASRYGRTSLGLNKIFTKEIAKSVFKIYDDYTHLQNKKKEILETLNQEEEKFNKTLEKGLKKFKGLTKNKKTLSGKEAFLLFQSYGFPIEMTEELAKEKGIKVDEKGFEKEKNKHQELSRTATKGKFQAGLADQSEETKKLHTATHLLHAALRQVLGKQVKQMGSNITPERLRFDFSYPKKLTEEEKNKVEQIVNEKIKQGLPVNFKEMPYEKAVKTGALSFFKEKYPDIVKVYTIGNSKEPFSREICTGPHVKNTKEMGTFKIKKEESSSAGVRRIKAVLE